jgi:membrane protein required for beta-lactamase induction
MTSHELYIALFWIVIGGYATYLGWTLYHIATESAARARHPSHRQGSLTTDSESGPAERSPMATRTK